MDPGLLKQVSEYQHGNMISSQSKALTELITLGLGKELITRSERDWLKLFGELNESGRELLVDLADTFARSKKYKREP
jgi:hypothetical protein